MKSLYPLFFWGKKAAENPEETVTFLGIILELILWAIQVAISAAILALIAGGIAKLFGKDFIEWVKGSFIVLVIIMILSTILQCIS